MLDRQDSINELMNCVLRAIDKKTADHIGLLITYLAQPKKIQMTNHGPPRTARTRVSLLLSSKITSPMPKRTSPASDESFGSVVDDQ